MVSTGYIVSAVVVCLITLGLALSRLLPVTPTSDEKSTFRRAHTKSLTSISSTSVVTSSYLSLLGNRNISAWESAEIFSPITVVSGYWHQNKTKHFNLAAGSRNQYHFWMSIMLRIRHPMVVFCERESVDLIMSFRPRNNTKIVISHLGDFYTYRWHELFESQRDLDPRKRKDPTTLHYYIYNEKSHFLKRVIELNPYHSDLFFWVDIGCFRRARQMSLHYLNWPDPAKVRQLSEPEQRVIVNAVCDFYKVKHNCHQLRCLGPTFVSPHTIAGAMFGGTAKALLRWHPIFYKTLQRYFDAGRFAGNDQTIMATVCILFPELVHIVRAPVRFTAGKRLSSMMDGWFWLQPYLAPGSPLPISTHSSKNKNTTTTTTITVGFSRNASEESVLLLPRNSSGDLLL